jgi:hypothetical protein
MKKIENQKSSNQICKYNTIQYNTNTRIHILVAQNCLNAVADIVDTF